jgi:hypothetical protein
MRILYFTKTLLKLIRSGITAKRPAQTFEMGISGYLFETNIVPGDYKNRR